MHELHSWNAEKRSAFLYRIISDQESGTPRQILFLELAKEADKQATLWEVEARKVGITVPEAYKPDIRTRIIAKLVRVFGPRALRSALAAMKVRGMSIYSAPYLGHGMPSDVSEVGQRHRGMSGGANNLRASVFGINDGLVSNTSLIMGVAGATSNNSLIVLSGLAGLIAGAFSMASGEYVSVRSQREMYEYQIGLERDELKQYPEEEAAELALIYEARGLTKAEAEHMAKNIIADPDKALDTLSREELGLNPEELTSPWGAALFSFFSFAVGACVPLLPFLFVANSASLLWAITLSAIALFCVGSALSLFIGRNAVYGGLRMLLIGVAASVATYLIGAALGVGLK